MPGEAAATVVNETHLPDWSARVYGKQKFAGAGKSNSGLLVPLERRLARCVLPRIPSWIETYHLTLLTPFWSLGIVGFCYLAKFNLRWLWMVNLMIVLHYFTDHFDGKLGKYRDTGLCKWGFYMDHLFDYGFLCSILLGYTLADSRASLLQHAPGAVRLQRFHVSHVPDAGDDRGIQSQLLAFRADGDAHRPDHHQCFAG